MSIKVREPGDAFKRQVTEFVPVKKRRPWRDEEALEEKDVETSRQGATASMANPAIAETDKVDHASMANPAIAETDKVNQASMANPAIDEIEKVDQASMANPAIDETEKVVQASMANAAIDALDDSKNLERDQLPASENSFGSNPLGLDQDPNLARSQRARASFVFNVAIKRIGYPMDSLLFCYLWHRVEETGTTQIRITLNEMSEAIGASKRGIQDAIKRLNELGLMENMNAGTTYVPILKLNFGFKKSSKISKNVRK